MWETSPQNSVSTHNHIILLRGSMSIKILKLFGRVLSNVARFRRLCKVSEIVILVGNKNIFIYIGVKGNKSPRKSRFLFSCLT